MNVLSLLEGGKHGFILRHDSYNSQLNLGIVHRKQVIARGSHKSAAHLASLFGAGGNVLQVGVGGRQPACDRPGLVVGGVHALCCRINLPREGFQIGGAQLGNFPVFQDQVHHRVLAAQFLQHTSGCGIMPAGSFLAAVRRFQF